MVLRREQEGVKWGAWQLAPYPSLLQPVEVGEQWGAVQTEEATPLLCWGGPLEPSCPAHAARLRLT